MFDLVLHKRVRFGRNKATRKGECVSLEPVVDISKPKKVFSSLEEAQSFVAIIYRMTEKIYQEVQDSIELLETLNNQKTQTSSLYNNSTKKQKIDEISSRLNYYR